MINVIAIGRFTLQQCSEPFSENSDYRECLLTERSADNLCSYYIHLHKDNRFPEIDFRFQPDEKDTIRSAEFRSYEHRKDLQQPTWKLHTSTIEKIVARLHELTNAEAH